MPQLTLLDRITALPGCGVQEIALGLGGYMEVTLCPIQWSPILCS